MNLRHPSRSAFFGGLLLVAVLPLVARTFAGSREGRCALDGLAVDARRAVRIEEASGSSLRFCGIRCAQRFLAGTTALRAGSPRAIYVTDEASGTEIPAASAVFVESLVAAVPATGDHVHAFARLNDALRHASAYRGAVLDGPERPFRALGTAAGGGR